MWDVHEKMNCIWCMGQKTDSGNKHFGYRTTSQLGISQGRLAREIKYDPVRD